MGRPTKYTHDNDDEIARKYQDESMSLRALSLEYGIPVMTIKRRLKAWSRDQKHLNSHDLVPQE